MRRFAALLGTALCLSVTAVTSAAGAAGCPNEALRAGPSALLPGCRAYEMVSPVDKAGGSVGEYPLIGTDEAGNVVRFYSSSAFAGNQADFTYAGYVADRDDDAWGTTGVEGPQYNEFGFTEFASPAISADGSKSFTASRLALAPGAIEGGSNLYLRDVATGAYQLIAAQPGPDLWTFVAKGKEDPYSDGTADWSKVLLSAPYKLTADATDFSTSQGRNLYEFSGGRLRLANIMPNGEPAPEGGQPIERGHSLSADGSRAFFFSSRNAASAGPFYVRIDGERTVAISRSRRPADEGAVIGVDPLFATADGSLAFFLSNQELLPDDEVFGRTIYRYDVDTGELTDVIPDKPAGGVDVRALLAAGEEGSLFFETSAGLLPGVEPVPSSSTNLYVSRNGRLEFVATAEEEFPLGAASRNGRWFALETSTPLRPAEDPSSPTCQSERCRDIYVFDADTETLRCASCAPGADGNQGDSSLGNLPPTSTGPQGEAPSGPKYVTSITDGGTVFFQTSKGLSPRDINGIRDVYAWIGGTVSLISTGTSPDPSGFANATPDGSSVFFVTSQSLVPQDTDANADVYADRELGGLASQYPVGAIRPCGDESCRGASPSAPAPNPSGSAASGGEDSCLAPAAAAKRAGTKAHSLARSAKRAARSGAARRAKQLRRRAKAESGKAKGLRKRAGACRGAGR